MAEIPFTKIVKERIIPKRRLSAGEIFVETDTGDVTGSLLTDKVFITQTDTGSIDVSKIADGGKCEISTDTGDIRITMD